mmetsp:Transcript_54338/g.176676  ORF Transcript_54338/g.176676 Transcript_54338/m.176676 type:complete len:209 (+) Transcript_54338:109-735(+)
MATLRHERVTCYMPSMTSSKVRVGEGSWHARQVGQGKIRRERCTNHHSSKHRTWNACRQCSTRQGSFSAKLSRQITHSSPGRPSVEGQSLSKNCRLSWSVMSCRSGIDSPPPRQMMPMAALVEIPAQKHAAMMAAARWSSNLVLATMRVQSIVSSVAMRQMMWSTFSLLCGPDPRTTGSIGYMGFTERPGQNSKAIWGRWDLANTTMV